MIIFYLDIGTESKMDIRKIQRTSGGTFFVCLPKAWAKKNNLVKGSLVSVIETTDGKLAITPRYSNDRTPKTTIITSSPLLDREIVEKYLLGYDSIQVVAKERIGLNDRERVKEVSSHLIGLEIIEETTSKIVLQCLLEPSTFPPQKILQREYSIASGMHRDSVTSLTESDIPLAKSVIARDNEVNRLYFLLVRLLRTVIQNPGLSESFKILPIDCLDYRLTASLVEAIGDHSSCIGEQTIKLGDKQLSERVLQLILRLHTVAYDAHENAITAVFSHDVPKAESVRSDAQKVQALFTEIESISRNQSEDRGPIVLAISSAICRIFDNSLDIADLVMPKLL